MKKLKEEIEKAKKETNEAFTNYTKKNTKMAYDWYLYCKTYLEGLQKAYRLIEGEHVYEKKI